MDGYFNAPWYTGVAEPVASKPLRGDLTASLVRGVLFLAGSSSASSSPSWLLDAAGRKVMVLRAGANDVSRLTPGIYFVREAQAQAQAVRKIVVTR